MTVLRETAAMLRSLRGVWDEAAVDELDHALQSAAMAVADGADDELLLAAALHDIGHSPLLGGPGERRHDELARDWLTPRFGPRVGWLAGAHVEAKRYLAATEIGYHERLSGTSAESLQAQGGATVEQDWVDHPWWADALRLRRYDDAAKNPDATGATIDDVLQSARRVLRRQG